MKTSEKAKEENGPPEVPLRALPVPFANLYDQPIAIDLKIEQKLSSKKKKEIFIDEAIISSEPTKKVKTTKNRDLVKFQPDKSENLNSLDDETPIKYD